MDESFEKQGSFGQPAQARVTRLNSPGRLPAPVIPNSEFRIPNSRPRGAPYQVGAEAISSAAAGAASGLENQYP